MVLNLLPPITVTKGSAVRWLAKEHALEAVVYLGDDVTDAHAFRALKALHDMSAVETLSVGVVGAETPLTVRQLSDEHVPSVEAVADLLCGVAEEFAGNGDRMDAGVASARRDMHGPSGHD